MLQGISPCPMLVRFIYIHMKLLAPALACLTYHILLFYTLQLRKINKKTNVLSQPVNTQNIKKFTWEKVVREGKDSTPALISCIQAALPTVSQLKLGYSKGRKSGKRYICILCVLFFHHLMSNFFPHKCIHFFCHMN